MYLLRSLFVVDGTHVFSHVSVLLSFADFSCQERNMTYTGLHARISVCSCLAVDVLIRRVSSQWLSESAGLRLVNRKMHALHI